MRLTGYSLTEYLLAKCLDGSPGRYYISEGDPSTWFIFYEGGGFCGSLAECQARARGYLGSTHRDAAVWTLDGLSYFSRNASANPLLANASYVWVRYCDGGHYAGDRTEPVATTGAAAPQMLFYRGRWITQAVLDDLATRGLAAARTVVLGGCSAGAIRLFAHIDALRAAVGVLAPQARVVGFSDSGFFLDRPQFTKNFEYEVAADGHNATALLSPACLAAHRSAHQRCLVAEVTAPLLATPMFAWQSRFDTDQRNVEMNATCAQSASCVNAYGAALTATMRSAFVGSNLTTHGAFIDSCSRHCNGKGPEAQTELAPDGLSPLEAFAAWVVATSRDAKRLWLQPQAYPCSACCGSAGADES